MYYSTDKVYVLEEIAIGELTGEVPDYSTWVFAATEFWGSKTDEDYFTDNWSYWDDWGYCLNEEDWFEYYCLNWAIAGYSVDNYEEISDWESYWEHYHVCNVEQILLKV